MVNYDMMFMDGAFEDTVFGKVSLYVSGSGFLLFLLIAVCLAYTHSYGSIHLWNPVKLQKIRELGIATAIISFLCINVEILIMIVYMIYERMTFIPG